jgi:UDP-N-acetylmuramyl pentapeptide phosphotransferase/UDP-N-acetylglucosamine-1-phosphate transferase
VSAELSLVLAFTIALLTTLVATPLAIAVAGRTNFHDKPAGYKGHALPTPYLGGAAVLGGFLVAAAAVGGELARLAPIVGCTCALWALGTVDDRLNLPALPRMAAEASLAILLWATDLGWEVLPWDGADLALTVVWVVGLVNAFNLFDNMDGAAATLATVTGIGVAVLAFVQDDPALAILTLALAGACLGFLPYNLARPARIFLGDGGSLPIGFVIAAALMALQHTAGGGVEQILAAVLLAGLPVVDTSLVMVSRRRAGISLLTGGRDHLTHRLLSRLGTARNVAVTLGVVQAGLAAVAIGAVQAGRGSVIAAWSIWFVVAVGAIALLESSAWAPQRDPLDAMQATTARAGGRGPIRALPPTFVEALVIAFISISCGLSPFLYGFYDVGVWGPIALGLLAVLLGLLIARPAAPRWGALLAAGALAGLWLWSLLSTSWAESADQAMTEANRWLLYAALFGILVLLLRDDRLGAIVIGAGTAVIAALGGYLLLRMMDGSASELFLNGRLHEPLGYVNGQAAYLLLGVWPLVAIAERARRPALAGAAISGAVVLTSLAALGQTRAVVPALLISAAAVLIVVPGRVRRGWSLVVVSGGVAACIGPVLEVYDSVAPGAQPGSSVLRDAAMAIALAAAVAGGIWAAAMALSPRVSQSLGARRAAFLAWAPLALLAALAVVIALGAVSDPLGRAKTEYRSFTQLSQETGGSSRFTSGGGNRYDYWRVAWHQFRDAPLRGVGAGNYDHTYFLERRTTEDIRQPHSIELQTLAELGVVGGGLLALFVVVVLAGLVRRARAGRQDPGQAGLAVAAGGTFLLWLVHTSVDWLHLIPGLTGIALCCAAVLIGSWAAPQAAGGGRLRIAAIAACALAVGVGAVLIGRSALSDRDRAQGQSALTSDPVRALQKSRDALVLNDESLPAYYLQAAAWARLGEYRPARAALLEATRREPHDFVSWALLGDLATRRGDRRQAVSAYGRAATLNPRDHALAALALQTRRSPAGRTP